MVLPDKAASHVALLPSLVGVHSPSILVMLQIWQQCKDFEEEAPRSVVG